MSWGLEGSYCAGGNCNECAGLLLEDWELDTGEKIKLATTGEAVALVGDKTCVQSFSVTGCVRPEYSRKRRCNLRSGTLELAEGVSSSGVTSCGLVSAGTMEAALVIRKCRGTNVQKLRQQLY